MATNAFLSNPANYPSAFGAFIPNPLAPELVKHDLSVKVHLRSVAEQGLRIAQAFVPVDTGALKASLGVMESSDGEGWMIFADSPYWQYVEFDTVNTTAQPFLRPVIDALGLNR